MENSWARVYYKLSNDATMISTQCQDISLFCGATERPCFELLVVMLELYSVSCIGMLPFIEDLSETVQSGLVASSHDSEEHA